MKKLDYVVKNVLCPHCGKSLVSSGKIQVSFLYDNKEGYAELDLGFREYDIVLYKQEIPLFKQVPIFCPHCKTSLNLPKEPKYFYFVTVLEDNTEDYAFMSSVYGDLYTVVAAKSIGQKFVRGSLRLEHYRGFFEYNNRNRDYHEQIEYYSRNVTFIPGCMYNPWIQGFFL